MINVRYLNVVGQSDANNLTEHLLAIDPEAEAATHAQGPTAVGEWATPPVIAAGAFILGGIAGGFFNEAGKQLFDSLKDWIKEAYKVGSRNPAHWQRARKEPTLQDAEEDVADDKNPPSTQSPPLSFTVRGEEHQGSLHFVFYNGMTEEEVERACACIPDTVHQKMAFLDGISMEVTAKVLRSDFYRSSMPEDMWNDRLRNELQQARMLVEGYYVFDSDHGIWVKPI